MGILSGKRVLFLTNLVPYPLDNGGKIKTNCSLNALSGAGATIDLVAFNEDDPGSVTRASEHFRSLGVDCHFVRGKLTTANNLPYMLLQASMSLISSLPFAVYKYRKRDMRRTLKGLTSSGRYDLIYIDHLQMAVFLDDVCSSLPVVLDEHNCETELSKQRLESCSNAVKSLFLRIEHKKMALFESKMLNRVDEVIVLTDQDRARLQELAPEARYTVIPIGVQDRGVKRYREQRNPLRLLFLGTMSWQPNAEGIEWFIGNVLPKLENVELVIAGKGMSEHLRSVAENAGATVLGYVDSVSEVYDSCDVMIVPLFMGSGQRVKILEAFSKGMPVVSTSVGIEGIDYMGSRAALVANSENQFRQSIERLSDSELYRQASHDSRAVFEQTYSCDAVAKLLRGRVVQIAL